MVPLRIYDEENFDKTLLNEHKQASKQVSPYAPAIMRKSVYIREGLVGRIYIYTYLARMPCFMAWMSFVRREVVSKYSLVVKEGDVRSKQNLKTLDKELYKNGSFVIKYLLLISLGRHCFVVGRRQWLVGWLTGDAGGMRVY